MWRKREATLCREGVGGDSIEWCVRLGAGEVRVGGMARWGVGQCSRMQTWVRVMGSAIRCVRVWVAVAVPLTEALGGKGEVQGLMVRVGR